jgi:hypothetical protein
MVGVQRSKEKSQPGGGIRAQRRDAQKLAAGLSMKAMSGSAAPHVYGDTEQPITKFDADKGVEQAASGSFGHASCQSMSSNHRYNWRVSQRGREYRASRYDGPPRRMIQ